MTQFEDIARQRLYLVHDNPNPRPMPKRMGFLDRMLVLAIYTASACIALGAMWGLSVLLLSLG